MSTRRRLLFFTYSFPYGGIGEGWKRTELTHFTKAFDELVVVPFWREGDNSGAVDHYPNLKVEAPLFTVHPSIKANADKLLRSKRVLTYLSEFFRAKPFRRKLWLDSWLTSSLFIEGMTEHPRLRELLFTKSDAETYLYFFWGVDGAYIIPFLPKDFFRKIIVRFHGYDLYEDDPVYSGYLPYRKAIYAQMTDALFVSGHGLEWMKAHHHLPHVRLHLAILGAEPCPPSVVSEDGVLRILTCSSLVPLKRVHLLAEALSDIDFPVEWTHLGGGEEEARVKTIVARFPEHVKAIMPGFVIHSRIREFYAGKSVDLFINISETEGMPVSIMEAMAAGVPVIATAVGGSPEIVGDANGRILPRELTADLLRDAIAAFYQQPREAKAAMRAASSRIYEDRLNAQTNAARLAQYILS